MAEKDGVETKNFPPPSNIYRPRCFFDVQINKVEAGRLIFELFPDICPKTCENFRALCTGEKGEGKTTSKPLHYKNTVLHRIVKSFIIQGGDFSAGDGTGGESIYGATFKDENFELHHDRPFLLSMANCGANTNGSQFFITLATAHHLDNVHTVFGHVLFGQDIVRDMENQKVNANHKPYADIRISHCGELIKKAKIVTKKPAKSKVEEKELSSESSSSSDSDSKHRKKRKREKSKENEKPTKKDKVKEKEYVNIGNKVAANVNEPTDGDLNFIPTVPSTFLMRRSRTPSPVRERRRKEGLNNVRRREPVLRTRVNMISRSGKKLRGRGVMRYRTPTPESTDDEEEEEEEVSPKDTGAGDEASEKPERLSEKPKEKERHGRNQENESKNEQKTRNHRRSQSKSNDKRRSLSKSNDKRGVLHKSKSRSRERRRPRSRSRSRRKSRSRERRRSRSRSVGRYRRRTRSFERRRPRFIRRSRSRSRKRTPPRNRSRSTGRRRSPKNPSRERKGKFERHRSKSGSGSDSSQERKRKLNKDGERKVEKLATDKPTIKEKIDRLFQKKEEESKAALAAAAKYQCVEKTEIGKNEIADFSISNVTPAPLNINEFQCGKGTSESQTLYPAIQNENSAGNQINDTISESQKLPPPHSPPRYELSAIRSNTDRMPSPNLKVSISSKKDKLPSFPTGIDEKSSLARRDVYGDDFVATSIEEENITGYLFEAKENSHVIKGDFHTKNDSHGIEDNSHSTKANDIKDNSHSVDIKISKGNIEKANQHGEVEQSVDEINKSKGKIGELQEKIREFKEFKYQLSEKIDFSAVSINNKKKVENGLPVKDEEENVKVVKSVKCKKDDKVESDSHSGSEDREKNPREKKRSHKFNKRRSRSENGKDEDDESEDDEKVSKKKGKKRKDPSSSDLSDEDVRKKKDRRKHDSRKSRKSRRSERTSSSSRSESDNEKEHKGDSHHSEKPTDADDESTVEADRDRKKNKKNKHKRKRGTTERSHDSEEDDNDNKRHKQKRKTKRRNSDYNSESSEEDRKRRNKRRRKKRRVSRESSSEDISEDDYEKSSRKRKLKSYEKKRDRKRKKRRNSIST